MKYIVYLETMEKEIKYLSCTTCELEALKYKGLHMSRFYSKGRVKIMNISAENCELPIFPKLNLN